MTVQDNSPKLPTLQSPEPLGPATRIIPSGKDTVLLPFMPQIDSDAPFDTILIVFEAEQFEKMVVPVGETILIGREHLTNAIQPALNLTPYDGVAKGVSRLHASIRHSSDGWWLTDLNSSNASWVNSERLAPRAP